MPRQKPFDKRTATTFKLVNRPQNDPRIHDEDASSQVFTEINNASSSSRKQARQIKQRGDLEEEFGLAGALNEIKGDWKETEQYGIYYDDGYDYTQHLRDTGAGGGESVLVEADQSKGKEKAKHKVKLEDALKEVSLADDDAQSVATSSRGPINYGEQKDIPDELSGFQPDMDPRLREMLEALEDEAYVDYDEGDDMFGALVGKGTADAMDQDSWEADYYIDDEDDEGWESDDTTKPVREFKDNDDADVPAPELAEGDLMASLAKSKGMTGGQLTSKQPKAPSSAAFSTATMGRRKKRKGAMTSSSGFSMSSSALARTDALSVLDSRFDKIADDYMGDLIEEDEEENMSLASGATGMSRASKWGGSQWGGSQAPSLTSAAFESAGFNSVMDDFLGSSEGKKGRMMKKGGRAGYVGHQSGLEQLDEIRKGLGPARLRQKS